MKQRTSGKTVSVPAGLGISLLTNVLITAIAISLIAYCVEQKKIPWETVGVYIMFMLLISSHLGAKAAISAIRTQYLLVSAMSGLLYWMFLLCFTALFFGGSYDAVFETGGLIMAGSMTAAMIRLPCKKASIRNYQRKSR